MKKPIVIGLSFRSYDAIDTSNIKPEVFWRGATRTSPFYLLAAREVKSNDNCLEKYDRSIPLILKKLSCLGASTVARAAPTQSPT